MTGLNFTSKDTDADPLAEHASDYSAVIEERRTLLSGIGQIRRDLVDVDGADTDTKTFKALILLGTRDPAIRRIAVIGGVAQLGDGLAHSWRGCWNDDTCIERGV